MLQYSRLHWAKALITKTVERCRRQGPCGTYVVLSQVPCVAVVENMSYFEVDGVRHLPFGAGSGDRIVRDFGLPNLIRFPIVADLSLAGDGEAHCYRSVTVRFCMSRDCCVSWR